MRRTAHAGLVLALLSVAPGARAGGQSGAPAQRDSLPPLPRAVGFVNDFAGVASAPCRARMERIAHEVKAKSKGEIVVVTLRSLHSRPIEEWGPRIGGGWGVGFAGPADDPRTNTGVVILLAPTERQSRVELADGANAFISDERAGRIMDEQMMSSFKNGDFGVGLLRGVNAFALEFARRFGFTLESAATTCGSRTAPR